MTAEGVVCPACHAPGKPISGQTVKALLAVSLRGITADDYCFCATAACAVVYFSPMVATTFTIDQLREPVYQKQPTDPDVWVCYCFRHRRGALQAVAPDKQQQLVADITAGIQAGQCACDLRNPQGSCCLGNVQRLIKQDHHHR